MAPPLKNVCRGGVFTLSLPKSLLIGESGYTFIVYILGGVVVNSPYFFNHANGFLQTNQERTYEEQRTSPVSLHLGGRFRCS